MTGLERRGLAKFDFLVAGTRPRDGPWRRKASIRSRMPPVLRGGLGSVWMSNNTSRKRPVWGRRLPIRLIPHRGMTAKVENAAEI